MKVRITDKHLKGRVYSVRNCPLQAALQEQYPNETVIVGGHFVGIGPNRYEIVQWSRLMHNVDSKTPCEVELTPCAS